MAKSNRRRIPARRAKRLNEKQRAAVAEKIRILEARLGVQLFKDNHSDHGAGLTLERLTRLYRARFTRG